MKGEKKGRINGEKERVKGEQSEKKEEREILNSVLTTKVLLKQVSFLEQERKRR